MIETNLGALDGDSTFQKRGWIWGDNTINAHRSRLDDTVIVQSVEAPTVEIDGIELNQYVPSAP